MRQGWCASIRLHCLLRFTKNASYRQRSVAGTDKSCDSKYVNVLCVMRFKSVNVFWMHPLEPLRGGLCTTGSTDQEGSTWLGAPVRSLSCGMR